MRIVPALDEPEDGEFRFGLGAEPPPIEELAFQGGEEAFRERVVVRVADRAARGSDAHLGAALPEGERGVLGGFNRSSQHRLNVMN